MDRIKKLAGLLMRDGCKKFKDDEYYSYWSGIFDLVDLIEKTEHIKNINHTLKTDEYLTYNNESKGGK
tara:strand:+ start:333 stop:536 length:204 start_codon:yes stop_codon:yes gene_type:complete